MTAISVTKARENIYQLISDVNANCQPITITNNKGRNAVLIGEEDWRAIEETLFLMSIPNMAESIMKGGDTPLDECLSEDEVEWQVFRIVYEKQAGKDIKNLKSAGLDKKAKELIEIIRMNPFQIPPVYESLVGNLQGYYSRRINIQHRLVYQVYAEPITVDGVKYQGTIKIIRMWTHYDGL